MDDQAVAKLCREWISINAAAIQASKSTDYQDGHRHFSDLYGSLLNRSLSLVEEAAARGLDSLPLSSLPPRSGPPSTCTPREADALRDASVVVNLLLGRVSPQRAPVLVPADERHVRLAGSWLQARFMEAPQPQYAVIEQKPFHDYLISLGASIALVVDICLARGWIRRTRIVPPTVIRNIPAALMPLLANGIKGSLGYRILPAVCKPIPVDERPLSDFREATGSDLPAVSTPADSVEIVATKFTAATDEQPQWDKATEARNKWMYDEACKGTPWETIVLRLNRKPKSWDRIESAAGIRAAVSRYVERHDLPRPPRRKAGRPPQRKSERK